MSSEFDERGNLSEGIHLLSWDEIILRYGYNPRRTLLLSGLKRALDVFKFAGCRTVYLDGSFVTTKRFPNDYDCCWVPSGVDPSKLDPILLDPTITGRKKQKFKYQGEFLPSTIIERASWKSFLDFFQTDKETGERKGIVKIDLEGLP